MPSNQLSHTLSISEAAEAVGVTIHSIRRWAEWHSAYLSPGANPETGQPKRFAGRDIEVLKHVKALRSEGLQTIAINEKLAGLTFAEIEVIDTPGLGSIEPEAIQTAPEALQAVPAQNLTVDYLQAIERRFLALETAREDDKREQRGFVQGLALGFIAAALFFLILVVLISIYRP